MRGGALASGHPLEPLGRAWPDVLGGARKRFTCRAARGMAARSTSRCSRAR